MTALISSHWYVVQTHANAETKAAMHLQRQGFESYLPRYLKRRRHARRTETVAAPLFPRYLFVAFDASRQRWRSIQSTFGVTNLVCTGEDPATLPNEIVENIRHREDERGFICMDTAPKFAPGDKVQVVEGVFSLCSGLFESMTDRERVTILLDFLGRKVRVAIDVDSVVAA
jgi:transcriptional antiterminator RfaH